ncbi:hypothetical protein [Pararhodospirillum photometricum]|nr:hypothetical protein [Pararhodospirillum photometricum]
MKTWLLGLMAAALLAPALAQAQDRGRLYGKGTAAFWKVGELNKELTSLCRRGLFNQVNKERLYIGYVGSEDGRRTLTGIAKKDYNLRDPKAKAEDNVTYHFHNDGYSTCRVYIARDLNQPPGRP